MAAKIATVSPDLIWAPDGVERLWFFPDGSEHLRYSAHFHVIYESGMRQNFPLSHWASPVFVVVFEGKLSVKDFNGKTITRIHVRDQVWYLRDTQRPAQGIYALMLSGNRKTRRRAV